MRALSAPRPFHTIRVEQWRSPFLVRVMIPRKCMGVRRMELVEPSPPMIESGREWKKVNREDMDGSPGNTGDELARIQVEG
jgi:hypothetical protein